jgi:hypothetical protein
VNILPHLFKADIDGKNVEWSLFGIRPGIDIELHERIVTVANLVYSDYLSIPHHGSLSCEHSLRFQNHFLPIHSGSRPSDFDILDFVLVPLLLVGTIEIGREHFHRSAILGNLLALG